jgi:hypothetical protein
MGKKFFITVILILFVSTMLLISANTNNGAKSNDEIITKTYELKYISPYEAKKILSSYLFHSTAPKDSPFFTVRIRKQDLKQFEEILKKIDHERKNVRFKIYTIIASKNKNNWKIDNREISEVINKINSIFSFKSYKLDGISSITVKDGTGEAKVKLSSNYNLFFRIRRMVINNNNNNPKIDFYFSLYKERSIYKGKRMEGSTILSSSTCMNNNGYFIAGVSKLGNNGDSLILVIKATVIK